MASKTILLRRLLKRQAVPLLKAFETLMPGRGLALIERDGSLFARAGNWPEAALAQMSAKEDVARRLTAANGEQGGNYRYYPLLADSHSPGALVVYGEAVYGEAAEAALTPEQTLHLSLELLITQAMERRAVVSDALNRYRELNLLYRVGETIGAALNPELIPQLVLAESRQVIQADVGVEVGVFVERLSTMSGELYWENKASFGTSEQVVSLITIMGHEIDRLLDNGQPAIITQLPRASLPDGALLYSAVLWAPLKTPNGVLGGILLGRLLEQPIFTANDEKLLTSLAMQSALALENAHLFAQTDEKLARRVKELTLAGKRLRQQAMELKERNQELDAFAHTVAHDLKNPLGVVSGFTYFIKENLDSIAREALEEQLQIISRSNSKMTNIVDELLVLSSVRKEEVNLEPLDMARIVSEAQRRLADSSKEHQAETILPDVWPTALGYAPWIEEVWVNYLSNAIRYGGQPPRLELGANLRPDSATRFWVRDNGPGLAPEEQARLFVPFTKLGQVRAKGHGLGLSIVRRIVEKLGGQVGVESQLGQGSLFYFTLPGADN